MSEPSAEIGFEWSEEDIAELARQNAEQLGGVVNSQVVEPVLAHFYAQHAVFERALREVAGEVTALKETLAALEARMAELEEGR